MERLKTEVQVKFNTIADMSSHTRALLAPFGRFSSNLQIQRVNRPEERVILIFEEESYILSLDWNYLGLVHQGEPMGLRSRDGLLRFFLDTLEKVQALPGYCGIEFTRVFAWGVYPGQCPDASSFRRKYFTANVPEADVDAGIILIGQLSASRTYELNFGPYRYPNDAETHNLVVVSRRNDPYAMQLQALQGTFARVEVQAKQDRCDFELIQSMFQDLNGITRKLG